MIEANSIRPSGIQRKMVQSGILQLNEAGDHIVAMFPHSVRLLNIFVTVTTALTTADETIDIGIAKDGDTVIDGKVMAYDGSAVGDVLDVFQVKGTNGGVIDVPAGSIIWLQVEGTGTAGEGIVTVEYVDNSN